MTLFSKQIGFWVFVFILSAFNIKGQAESRQFGLQSQNGISNLKVHFIHQLNNGSYKMVASSRKQNYDSLQVHFITLNAAMEVTGSLSLMPEHRWGLLNEVQLLPDGYLIGFQIGTSSSTWKGTKAYITFDGQIKWSRGYDFRSSISNSILVDNEYFSVQYPQGGFSKEVFLMRESLLDQTHSSFVYTIEGEGSFRINSTLRAHDGSWYLAFEGDEAGLLIKIKESGLISWAYRIELNEGSRYIPAFLQETPEKNIQFVYTNNTGFNTGDRPTIIEIDTAGVLLWAKQYRIEGERMSSSALFSSGNELYLSMYRIASGNQDKGYLIRLDSLGNIQERFISEIKRSGFSYGGFRNFFATADKRFIALGQGDDQEALIQVVTRPTDVCRYSNTSTIEVGEELPQLTQASIIEAPYSYQITDSISFSIISGNSFEMVERCKSALAIEEEQPNKPVFLFPNPSSGSVSITGLTESCILSLYSISGSLVYQTMVQNQQEFSISALESGFYLWKIEAKNKSASGKLLMISSN